MKQKGFTLVEISIVLVVIAIILGGILNSKSLIASTKAKDVVAIIEDLRAATAYFKERYNYLPGDLPAPANYITATPALVAGTGGTIGNGSIEGTIAASGNATVGSESAQAPWQLFSAGLISRVDAGDPAAYLKTGFGPVQLAAAATANGLVTTYAATNPDARNVIIFFRLPCDVAAEVDLKVDNGALGSGRAMGTACANNVVDYFVVPLN